jgi:hypothetical protein
MLAHGSAIDLLRLAMQAATLLLTFVGAGLYLRGFWTYFRAVRWLRADEQEDVRKRYKSSAIAALLYEPTLAMGRAQLLQGLAGPILFAVGGIAFNALR